MYIFSSLPPKFTVCSYYVCMSGADVTCESCYKLRQSQMIYEWEKEQFVDDSGFSTIRSIYCIERCYVVNIF